MSLRDLTGDATVITTRGPLNLAEAAILGIVLSTDVEPLVKANIRRDVHAGRDLLRGSALAALRTADINLAALELRGHRRHRACVPAGMRSSGPRRRRRS